MIAPVQSSVIAPLRSWTIAPARSWMIGVGQSRVIGVRRSSVIGVGARRSRARETQIRSSDLSGRLAGSPPCFPASRYSAGLWHRERDLMRKFFYRRPSSPLSTRKLHQASEYEFFRREQVGTSQNFRGSNAPSNRLNGWKASPIAAPGETPLEENFLVGDHSDFQIHFGQWPCWRARVHKPFLRTAPLQRCRQHFRSPTEQSDKVLTNPRRLCGFSDFCGS